MSQVSSPTRPSRRTTARRPIIDDPSDEEELANATAKLPSDSEDDFVAEGNARNSRRQTRGGRKASTASSQEVPLPKARGRPKKSTAPAPKLEPCEILEPDQTTVIMAEPALPSKKLTSPRKRRSV